MLMLNLSTMKLGVIQKQKSDNWPYLQSDDTTKMSLLLLFCVTKLLNKKWMSLILPIIYIRDVQD